MSNAIPALLVIVPIVGALLTVVAGSWRVLAGRVITIATMAATTGLAIAGLTVSLNDRPIRHDFGGWPPPLGIQYVLDPLAGFVALIVAAIALVCVCYPSAAGFGETPRRDVPLYPIVLLLVAGLLGVVLSGDLFHLFVFLEIFSISSYALVAFGGDRAMLASLRYLLLGTMASGLYLLGVGFLYFTTGTLNMADMAARLPDDADSPTVTAAVVLIVIALALKAALFPLHIWLPDAHSQAPPVVAALLAAVQVKVAAYALIRVVFDIFEPAGVSAVSTITTLIAYSSAVGVVVGSVYAIRQTDIKRMLAWSTVSQLGMIGIGIGIGTSAALTAALLHVLSHAVMKSCLFLVAGGIIARTGTKHIPDFAGMGRRMPILMVSFTLAALSMVGIPPTIGFFSKWYLLTASIDDGAWFLGAVIVTSSLLTGAYFLRIFELTWSRQPEAPAVRDATDPGPTFLVPIALLAIALVLLGIANLAIVDGILDGVGDALTGKE